MKFSTIFKQQYYQKMLTPGHPLNPVRNRADNFLYVFEYLENIPNPVILETGVMRPDHGDMAFGDDGCSTFLFDQFINIHGGTFTSVDINETNCNHARSKISNKSTVVCSDSVTFLWDYKQPIDMVYLDSFDLDTKNPQPSQIHHLKELCSIMKNLQPHTLIVIDDHMVKDNMGKGYLIKEFMQQINKFPLFENYQLGFIFGK
jgi:hypothetical protein